MSLRKALLEIAFLTSLFPLDLIPLKAEPKTKACNQVLTFGCYHYAPVAELSPFIVATTLPLGPVES